MNRQRLFLMVVALAGSLLASGCKTVSRSEAATDAEASSSKAANGKKPSAQKLASAHAHYAAAIVHEVNGESALALQEFEHAAADDPDNETLILEVSKRLLQNKQPEKALEFLVGATGRGNTSGEVYARLGTVYTRLGKNEEALAANRMAVKKSPTYLIGYQNLFVGFIQAKQNDEALKLLEEGSRVRTNDAEFYIGVADLYQNYVLQFPTQRETVQRNVVNVLSRAESLKPTDSQTCLRLADALYAFGETKRASTIYLSLLKQVEDLPLVTQSIRAKLAEIYLRGDDHQHAREQLEAIVQEDPSNAQGYYFLGSIAYDDKEWTNAITQFKKTILLSPNFQQAYYDLAAAQLAASDAAGAVETMTTAREKFPASFIIEYLTAMAQSRQKNYAEAIKHFTSAEVIAKASEPKRLTADFYFEVGIVFERNGDRDEAVKHFQRAIELNPNFPEAQNYLGYMWAEKGENLDKAKELIERALVAEPKSAAYLDSMGWVLFKLKQPKEALDYVLKAVSLNEGPDATLYDHLGDIYSALSESDKARESWRKSLTVEDNEVIRKKLDSAKSP